MAAKGSKYEGLIKEAILALKERTGSSLPAIKKYISAHHGAETKPNWESVLSQQLKRLSASGKLVKVRPSCTVRTSIQTSPNYEHDMASAKPSFGQGTVNYIFAYIIRLHSRNSPPNVSNIARPVDMLHTFICNIL